MISFTRSGEMPWWYSSGESMVGRFQLKMRTLARFLNVGIHLQVQRVRVFVDSIAQPREHCWEFHAFGIIIHFQELFEVVAA